MGRSVAFQVTVFTVVRHRSLKLGGNIISHTGIGVLIHCDSGSGMRHENMADATLNTTIPHQTLNLGSNILKIYL